MHDLVAVGVVALLSVGFVALIVVSVWLDAQAGDHPVDDSSMFDDWHHRSGLDDHPTNDPTNHTGAYSEDFKHWHEPPEYDPISTGHDSMMSDSFSSFDSGSDLFGDSGMGRDW